MVDGGEADDKIIAVLHSDPLWSEVNALDQLPNVYVDRLRHYFTTYKLTPEGRSHVAIGAPYDRAHAEQVIRASMEDYEEAFGQ